MAYAIMRCTKLKMGGAAGSLSHTFRERETQNADPEKTPDNVNWRASSVDEAMGRMREELPDKFRKDAVVAVEYLFTTSPEWAAKATPEKQEQFFSDSLTWLADKYGSKNIFVATIHNDETTPHMAAYVVPKTPDGRLSAKQMLGGRKDFREAQSSFAEKVQHLGLERGIEGSKATHQRISQHYSQLNKEISIEKIKIKPEELKPRAIEGEGLIKKVMYKESEHAIAERINKKILSGVQPVAARAREQTRAVQQRNEFSRELGRSQQRERSNSNVMRGLNKTQVQAVHAMAKAFQKENAQTRAQENEFKQEQNRLNKGRYEGRGR